MKILSILFLSIPGQGGWDYLAVDEGARRLYAGQFEILVVGR